MCCWIFILRLWYDLQNLLKQICKLVNCYEWLTKSYSVVSCALNDWFLRMIFPRRSNQSQNFRGCLRLQSKNTSSPAKDSVAWADFWDLQCDRNRATSCTIFLWVSNASDIHYLEIGLTKNNVCLCVRPQ